MLDKATAIMVAQSYAEEVTKILKPNAVILFGSCVNGTPNEESDIDIAVLFNGFDGDNWKVSTTLWGLTRKIDDRIEPILVDSNKDSSGFVSEVLKTGQIIYSA